MSIWYTVVDETIEDNQQQNEERTTSLVNLSSPLVATSSRVESCIVPSATKIY